MDRQARLSPLDPGGGVASALRQHTEAERGGGRRLEGALHPLGHYGHDAGAGAAAQAAEREQIAVVLAAEDAAVGQGVAYGVRSPFVLDDIVDGRGPAQQGESSGASGPSHRVAAALLLVGRVGAVQRTDAEQPAELRRGRRVQRELDPGIPPTEQLVHVLRQVGLRVHDHRPNRVVGREVRGHEVGLEAKDAGQLAPGLAAADEADGVGFTPRRLCLVLVYGGPDVQVGIAEIFQLVRERLVARGWDRRRVRRVRSLFHRAIVCVEQSLCQYRARVGAASRKIGVLHTCRYVFISNSATYARV